MPKGKLLFIFDEKERGIANAINSGTLDNHSNKKSLFGKVGNFNQSKKIQSENLFFLAHTGQITTQSFFSKKSEQTIGGLTPTNFAKSLAAKYSDENKNKLKHVYLISCEAGFSNGKDCLAQNIADELYNRGFANVVIHAMTNPADAPKAGMRVKIIGKTGASQALGREIGDIQSVSYDATQIQQEEKGIDNPPYSSIRRTQLVSEWNRAVNTFTPTQLPTRKPTPPKKVEQEKILYKLDQTIKNELLGGKKPTDKLITNLNTLRDNFANAIDYKDFINKETDNYANKSKHPDRSSYLLLLKGIQKDLNHTSTVNNANDTDKSRAFKTKYQQETSHLFTNIGNITITAMELKIDEALTNISKRKEDFNPDIVAFFDNNELVTKLLNKADDLIKEGSEESILKGKSIKLILEEAKLMGSFADLNNYLDTIKNASQVTNENDTPSFYQETLNRPRGIIDKILQIFGWEVKTQTAQYLDELKETVANKMAIKNRLNI